MNGGIGTFTDFSDNTPETISLKFTGGGLATSASGSIVVSPGPASRLVIQTQPAQTATAGSPVGPAIVVDEEDQYGNLETDDNTTMVTAEPATGLGPLVGTTKVTLVNGVATFSDVIDDTAESITLAFSGGGITSPASVPILVSPAAASELLIHTQPSSTASVHQSFATQPVIYETDKYGNLETGDSTTSITALLATGTGPLQGTASATLRGGIATFTDLSDNTPETISLKFTGGGLATSASGSIVVMSGPAASLVIETQPSQAAAAGTPFGPSIVIDEMDQYGNLVTDDSSTVMTAELATGVGSLAGTTKVTLVDGVATFSNLAEDTAGSITLAFSGNGLTSLATVPIVVSPAEASKLAIETDPSPAATAGVQFAVQPVIEEEDQYGNLEVGDSGAMVTVSLGSGTGPLLGAATATFTDGVATFAGLDDNRAETITLKFSSPDLSSVTSTSTTVAAGMATQLVVTAEPPSSENAGQEFDLVVSAEDKYGNSATTYSGDIALAVASNPGGSTLAGSITVPAVNGVATFSNLSLENPGNGYTLVASGNGLTSAPTTPFGITPAPTPTHPHSDPNAHPAPDRQQREGRQDQAEEQ